MAVAIEHLTGSWSESSAMSPAERRFAPSKLAVLVDVMAGLGVPALRVLEGTGLDEAMVRDPFTLTTPLHYLTAVRNAVALYDGDDLGLRVGQRLHASCYGMYGYALLCSASLREAFDTAMKFHRLANGMLQMRWVEHDDAASWIFASRDSALLPGLEPQLYRFLIDQQFLVFVTIVKDMMGSWCVPVSASFTEPQPPHAAALARALQCPVAFGQAENLLTYPAKWLARAPQLANPIAAAQTAAECATLLAAHRWQEPATRRVHEALTRARGNFPGVEAIAESLGMTSRTLRRKLEGEGTSYSELLTQVRKALAVEYLRGTALSTDDIACTLGFSDPVAFRHAFKRWTGRTPSDYRRSAAPAAA